MEKQLNREICFKISSDAYFLFLQKQSKIDQFLLKIYAIANLTEA